MDSDSGRIFPAVESLVEQLRREGFHLTEFTYGQRVQIKDCWFEVSKIDTKKQRLTLKPPDTVDALLNGQHYLITFIKPIAHLFV